MIVGLKCVGIDWEKNNITLSIDNLKEVREHYLKLYNEEKPMRLKRGKRTDYRELARWEGIIETLGAIISKTEFPTLSQNTDNGTEQGIHTD